MKNILLFTNLKELDRRVFIPCDYQHIWDDLIAQKGGNSGNKLFTFAVEKQLSNAEVKYEHYSDEMSIPFINDYFDIIVLPMANILNPHPTVIREMEYWGEYFSKIKIPVYLIGVGAQTDNYDQLDELCATIKAPAIRFIKSVINTGGNFALRGYFTKEVFERLGFREGVVTGCPSAYQTGRNLQIHKQPVEEREFITAINGDLQYLQAENMLHFLKSANTIFMDQNEYAELLYSHNLTVSKLATWDYQKKLVSKYTLTGLKILTESRVQLIYDVPVWLQYFKDKKINFSLGSRIHGNIAAILSGVPARVYYRDSRTRELAEFFDIPTLPKISRKTRLYDLYMDTDYTKFNESFSRKFDAFERFLADNKISKTIGSNSVIEEKIRNIPFDSPQIQNQEFITYLGNICRNNFGLALYDQFIGRGRWLKRKISKVKK